VSAPVPELGPRAEGLASIWARRAISIPVYLGLAGACLLGAPVWLLGALLLDLGLGQLARRPRARAVAFFALYLGCEALGLLAAAGIWCATLGGRIGGPARYLEANAALQRWWSSALFRGGAILFRWTIEAEGLELGDRGPLLLLVRHSSVADTVLTAALVGNPNRILLRYVLKRELLWDPCLDVVGRRLPNAFIDRAAPQKEAEVEAVARLARGLDAGSAVLIYPEGTRFSERKLERRLADLRERPAAGLLGIAETFSAVLPPHLGGVLALLDAAPGVDVALVEHSGFEGAATFAEFWGGALVGRTIRVRLRRFPADTIPEHGRDRWLYERWSEMDRWIQQPRDGGAPR
jgi:1-acyl-sn-glycerol-3-phosphate acyltransferase